MTERDAEVDGDGTERRAAEEHESTRKEHDDARKREDQWIRNRPEVAENADERPESTQAREGRPGRGVGTETKKQENTTTTNNKYKNKSCMRRKMDDRWSDPYR